jgi:RNAse (barnase) inhibitor barstar
MSQSNPLAKKILAAIDEENDLDVALDALTQSITYVMTIVCPDCRRNIAGHLKKIIPDMVRVAGELAEELEARPVCGIRDTHH